jgi:protein-L-isoaspartate(D-aspartate) O-methyltransferase
VQSRCRIILAAVSVQERQDMVERQLVARGVKNPRVLAAFARVPREAFVPAELAYAAYDDRALPLAHGQTISQPYVVALMLEALAPEPDDRTLEVGTGSGYAAALLAQMCAEVYTIERLPELADAARERLARLGCANVRVRSGDGTLGWPEAAPFDGILVSAGGPRLPPSLVDQLADGGRLVMPLGPEHAGQELVRVERRGSELLREGLGPVQFVPLIGRDA